MGNVRIGGWVWLRAYRGEIIRRRVVGMSPDVVEICRDEEYWAALRTGRNPQMVGFKWEWVVDEPTS